MYVYYILRGTQGSTRIELDGDVNEEQFAGVDLDNGPDIINHLVENIRSKGTIGEWDECDLTDSFFDREDNYINFNGRWIRRSDAPWRKDRNN